MQMSNVYPRLSPINRFSYSFRKVRVCAGACLVCLTMAAQAAPISVTNLVTNDQSAHSATITDPLLRNAWGVSHSPTSPFWVSDNATGLSTLYSVNPATNAIVKVPLEVSIPGDGSVTGQAFNPTANFNGDRFLFVSEDGTISGWRMPLGTTAETLVPGSPANVYKGVDFVNVGGNSYLYAANFRNGTIDIVKGNPGAPNLTGNFTDPSLPVGYAPFNIENIGGSVFVTYAVQSADKKDDVAGAGNGIINEFDINGNFVRRVATGGTLNAPGAWHWPPRRSASAMHSWSAISAMAPLMFSTLPAMPSSDNCSAMTATPSVSMGSGG